MVLSYQNKFKAGSSADHRKTISLIDILDSQQAVQVGIFVYNRDG